MSCLENLIVGEISECELCSPDLSVWLKVQRRWFNSLRRGLGWLWVWPVHPFKPVPNISSPDLIFGLPVLCIPCDRPGAHTSAITSRVWNPVSHRPARPRSAAAPAGSTSPRHLLRWQLSEGKCDLPCSAVLCPALLCRTWLLSLAHSNSSRGTGWGVLLANLEDGLCVRSEMPLHGASGNWNVEE